MITHSVIFFINSFQWNTRKTKWNLIEIKSICERVYNRFSFLFKYCLHVEIISANMGARQVHDYYNIRSFMYKGATALRRNTVIILNFLKDPSQPLLFSMLSKLLILHGEEKSCYFTVSCVPESMFNYL